MLNYIGLLGMVFLILILAAVFAVSLFFDFKRLECIVEREKQKIKLLEDLLSLSERIHGNSSKISKQNSLVNLYLSQVDFLLSNNPFQIDRVRVFRFDSKSRGNRTLKFTETPFFKSYDMAHKLVKKDINDLSKILESIYEINHPFRHKWYKFKKNISLRFLGFFISICSFYIDLLEKRCKTKDKDIKNRKKMVRLREKEINAQKLLSPIPLKVHFDEDSDLIKV